MAEEQPSLIDLALDVFLFAPLGAAVEARRLLPELARVGREHLDQRMPSYRAVGQLAVGQARKEASSRLRRLGIAPGDGQAGEAMPAAATTTPPPSTPRVPPAPDAPDVAALPIEDYDELSAVQVLPNLSGLDSDELCLVAEYERATRSRRTILGRIDQLLEKRA